MATEPKPGDEDPNPEIETDDLPETGAEEVEVEEGEEPDPELDEDDDEVAAPDRADTKPASRSQRRIQSLNERLRAAERERDEARALATQPRQASPVDQEAAAAARREKLLLMSPEERTEFLLGEQRTHFEQRLQMMELRQGDAADKTAFEAQCARKPHFAKVQDEVEKLLAEERRNGRNHTREALTYYLLGKRADERSARANGRQTRAAQAGRERERVPARGAARSDVGSPGRGRGDTAAARAKRLEDQPI